MVHVQETELAERSIHSGKEPAMRGLPFTESSSEGDCTFTVQMRKPKLSQIRSQSLCEDRWILNPDPQLPALTYITTPA